MIKSISVFAIVLMAFGFTASAQPVFTFTAGRVDSVTTGHNDDSLEYMQSYVVNVGTAPVMLRWQLITGAANRPVEWHLMGIADNQAVRPQVILEPDPHIEQTALLQPGDTSLMLVVVKVDRSMPDGLGTFKIKVFDSLQTQVDTLSFYLCKGTNCNSLLGAPALSQPNVILNLFPNPATDKVYLELANLQGKPEQAEVQLFNYTGRLLKQQKLKSTQETIDLAPYPPGLYLVRLRYKGQDTGVHKIIKR